MVIIIFSCLQVLTYMVLRVSSPDGQLTYFAIWSLITLAIFLMNAFELPQSGEKPFTRQDTLDYMKSFTGDHSIHNTFSLNLQYLIIAIINIVITIIVYKIQY
ncbi:hypothetical protein EZV73_10515 [Acidaminobacter sp. JC074]|uniref:hypothetical protein n=1 Tax=Acidaminobacter sp. JC074 TaxID=2530199 RepID=UPI001F0E7A5E|nr:hypothetical protein [Acidaminobacter sp. JC074]MCH4888009.1 hypothetical protein [Acidaminobacter sp. JC074]